MWAGAPECKPTPAQVAFSEIVFWLTRLPLVSLGGTPPEAAILTSQLTNPRSNRCAAGESLAHRAENSDFASNRDCLA